jgi:hypothetical protein
LSDTFSGIRPMDAPPFLIAQFFGAIAATFFFRCLVPGLMTGANKVLLAHDRREPSA